MSAAASVLLSREVWSEIPVFVSAHGHLIDIDFVPRLSGTYVLHFEDETGMPASRHFEVRLQTDPSPAVILERPSAAKDALAVLPDARFTIVAVANDIVRDKPTVPSAVRRVSIEYRTTAKEPFRRMVAYDGDIVNHISPYFSAFMRMPLVLPAAPSPRLPAYALVRWLPVKQFTHGDGSPLKEGDTLVLRVVAEDYDDVTWNKAIGASGEVELQIVSRSQLDAALQLQLAQMRNEILALAAMQRKARTRVQEAQQRLRQPGYLTREDLERLTKVEQAQQQIKARVRRARRGIAGAGDPFEANNSGQPTAALHHYTAPPRPCWPT